MADDPSPLSQDDIDALISAASGNDGTAPSPAQDKAPSKTNATTIDQDAIDALIAAANNSASPNKPPMTGSGSNIGSGSKIGSGSRSNGVSKVVNSVQDAAHASSAAANNGGPLGQDDIDRLLAELGGTRTPPTDNGDSKARSVPTTSIADAARSQVPGTTSSAAHASSAEESAVDALAVDPNATLVAPLLGSANAATLSLSPEDLDALVDKQVGTTSDHQEAPMIDQSDIDALVKQLAVATGAPDTKKISDALAKHEGEIDKLLEHAGDPKATIDAIPGSALLSASTGANKRGTTGVQVAVMAPSELKGTRWLLAAAVVFLAMCATTLGMVVGAIQGLSHELKLQHQAQLMPSDNFADDYKAALAQLHGPDAGEAAKGALFLQRLKKQYPSHEGEIALALARHYRSTGALRQASEEFAGLAEINLGHFDNPRLYLDYASCLAETGDVPAATRQVYHLLANENTYTGARDRHGLNRPADEVARNKQALQDAYLTLGRLLGDVWQDSGLTKSVAKHTSSAHDQAGTTPAKTTHAQASHGATPGAPTHAGHGPTPAPAVSTTPAPAAAHGAH